MLLAYSAPFKLLIDWWNQKRQERRDALMFERHVVVSFDAEAIAVRHPNGDTQSIEWDGIERVVIETNDSGPWGADVWWVLEGAHTHVAYPQGATGDSEMLAHYPGRFAGFDHQQVIKAMGCTDNARFVCWERQ